MERPAGVRGSILREERTCVPNREREAEIDAEARVPRGDFVWEPARARVNVRRCIRAGWAGVSAIEMEQEAAARTRRMKTVRNTGE